MAIRSKGRGKLKRTLGSHVVGRLSAILILLLCEGENRLKVMCQQSQD